MLRILGTIFAGALGLAFGSFLNVCLSRWPVGESVVAPRSHCRTCGRTLAWWENVPLLSWLALRGRCRTCGESIGWRYPLVEAAVGGLWATLLWQSLSFADVNSDSWALAHMLHYPIVPFLIAGSALFIWLLMTLAILDAEHLWLPDWLTLPGIAFGFLYTMLKNRLIYEVTYDFGPATPPITLGAVNCILTILAAAGLILLIRWVYWLVRKREGIGLGDAKLMALLAAWLGLPGALVAFALGVALGTITALVLLVLPKRAGETEAWTAMKLPLGTFLCIGGIVSGLWGLPIIAAYLRWAGFY